MFTQLRLHNFQCHADLLIPLDHPITCLVGPSDTGKSAVLRALKWALFNRPGGTAFVKDGTNEVQVELDFDDKTVTRARSVKESTQNTYELTGYSTASAFGMGVPDNIATALNVNSLNFQSQHDAPFWFSLSSGELSRELNELVNLQAMDAALEYLNKKLRDNATALETTYYNIGQKSKALDELYWVPSAAKALDQLLERHKTLQLRKQIAQDVRRLVKEAQSNSKAQADAEAVVLAGESALSLGRQLAVTRKLSKRLRFLLERRLEHRRQIGVEIPNVQAITKLQKQRESIARRKRHLRHLLAGIEPMRLQQVQIEAHLKQVQDKLDTIKVCPTCQRPSN